MGWKARVKTFRIVESILIKIIKILGKIQNNHENAIKNNIELLLNPKNSKYKLFEKVE